MKRIFAALLSLMIIFAFPACQPSPEKGVVAQKDTERMLEQAKKDASASNDSDSLSEQYGIPESYSFEKYGARGNLSISVDARVIIPEASALPIYSVRLAEFSQETVSAFFDALCGDAEMWIDSHQRTRAQINDSIIKVKARIALIKDDPEKSADLEMNEQILAGLEEQLKTAPETLEEIRTDGTLVNMNETVSDIPIEEEDETAATPVPQAGGSGTGLEAYERYAGGEGRYFYVNNDSSPSLVYCDFRNPASAGSFGFSSSLPVREDSYVDAEKLLKVGLKPGEAKQMVQSLLDKAGSGMIVDSMYLQDDAQPREDGTISPAERYAYLVYCVRTVDGLPCSYVYGESMTGADSMSPSWRYEQMYFTVNGEGIINMEWTCPLDVAETVIVDAQLKPFSEIREIFEKMIFIKNEARAEDTVYEFEINRVTLSLHRIIERNSNDSGLLIPAWNFYGKSVANPGDQRLRYEWIGESFLTINAIDGSVIDIYKGY